MLLLQVTLFFNMLLITKGFDNECCFQSDFAYRDNQAVALANYDSFSQLKFNCTETINISLLIFHPRKKLILDDSLSLKGVSFKITGAKPYFGIVFKNVRGFDLNSNHFKSMKMTNYKKEYIVWYFSNTDFIFYLNGSAVESNICSSKLPDWSIVSKSWILDLQKTVQFVSQICPYVFKNSLVGVISISRLSSSFVEKNVLIFQNVSTPDLNSTIFHLNIKFYHIDLN